MRKGEGEVAVVVKQELTISAVNVNLPRLLQVMEAEQARTRSEAEHKKTAANYNSCIGHMRQLEKKLKRSINKSRSVPLFPFLSPPSRASLRYM